MLGSSMGHGLGATRAETCAGQGRTALDRTQHGPGSREPGTPSREPEELPSPGEPRPPLLVAHKPGPWPSARLLEAVGGGEAVSGDPAQVLARALGSLPSYLCTPSCASGPGPALPGAGFHVQVARALEASVTLEW